MRTLRSGDDLVAVGLVRGDARADINRVASRYVIAVTPQVQHLIGQSDPNDPIAKQFIPDRRELTTTRAERADPIGDDAHSPVPGIVHRYDDRVLLKIASVCPVYCRFCFRRDMVGPDSGRNLSDADIDAALAYITATPRIREVILTGGDPLVLSPRRLKTVAALLDDLQHVEKLRIHTRVPVASPDLVTDERLSALLHFKRRIRLALHVNHARELSEAARASIIQIQNAGIEVISQSVLLRGVNDQATMLAELFASFFDVGMTPYYLHHPDLAPGTAHFRVALSDGAQLMMQVRALMPECALPSYVLDIPGGFGKVAVAGNVHSIAPGVYDIRDRHGRMHRYCDDLDPLLGERAA